EVGAGADARWPLLLCRSRYRARLTAGVRRLARRMAQPRYHTGMSPGGIMREFKDKVAVITGAASGIGRAIAERCVQEGMKAVLADVEVEPLTQTEASMKAAGATVLAVRTDVSQARDVEVLAQKTLEAFGAVHLLCNNAGVGAGASIEGDNKE